jgi:hypothetical protein
VKGAADITHDQFFVDGLGVMAERDANKDALEQVEN